MRQFLPHQLPSWRQIALWVLLGILLGTGLNGYWHLFCVLLVAVVVLFVMMQ